MRTAYHRAPVFYTGAMLGDFFRHTGRNLLSVFKPRNLLWHLLAIIITFVLVTSGADWQFFEHTRIGAFYWPIMIAGLGGFVVPIVVPIGIYLWGQFRERRDTMLLAAAAAQASALGYLVSTSYKVFTGRTQPEFITHYGTIDISREFHFGILQHGIFWGWPSSHAAVAFGGMVALALVSKKWWVRTLALGWALLVGFGAAVGFHWLSDVIAGAIIGSLAGVVVAKDFLRTRSG